MSAATTPNTALIVGASRGLGWGLVREYLSRRWRVIGTVREGAQRTPLHDLLAEAGGRLEIETVDINLPGQVADLRRRLDGRTLDLLFVNAGVANDPAETIGEVATEEFTRVMITNALSPLRVVERLAELVTPTGTVAVMSSGLASVGNNSDGGFEVYRASKAALNTLMRSFAARHQNDSRAYLCLAPGWVRTDMGGGAAPLDIATSVRGLADVIAARQGKNGIAYLDYQGNAVTW